MAGIHGTTWDYGDLVTRQRRNYKEIIVDTAANLALLDVTPSSRYAFGGNGNDSVGANNLTTTNVTYGTFTGLFGQYAVFNGTTALAQAASNTVHDVTTGDFSIWGFFEWNSVGGTNQTIVGKRNAAASSNKGYRIYISSTNKLVAEISDGTLASATTTASISNSRWIGFVLSCSRSGNMNLYTHYDLTDTYETVTTDISARTGSLTNTQTFTVARRSDSAAEFFNAWMDHLNVLIGTAVSQSQAKTILNDLGSGQVVYPLTTAGSFTAGTLAARNVENTAWANV